MFDSVIKNGWIVDGTRAKPFRGCVYIKNGKIAEISQDAHKEAARVFNANGHIVSPGFVDIHSHSDVAYLATSTMESKLIGGVTFELVGQCGESYVPLNEQNMSFLLRGESSLHKLRLTPESFLPRDVVTYAQDFEKRGVSINAGMLIGHGTLRSAVIGWEARQLTADESSRMCALLDEMLEQGAAGLSLGLIYAPGSFCAAEELLALAKVVAKHDKLLAVHMRNENESVFEALDEMLSVAKQSGVRLEISHLKLMGKKQWGRAEELLEKIDLARAQGVHVHCDQYPYAASHTGLTSIFPKRALDGGWKCFCERLQNDAQYRQLSDEMMRIMRTRAEPQDIIVSDTHVPWPEIIGKNLEEIAEMMNLPLHEAIRSLLLRCEGDVGCLFHCMDERDVLQIMARRDISVVSDGSAYNLKEHNGHPHPRNTGTCPRFLRLARENRLMPVEDAVYKLTGLPATVSGFGGRFGFLKEGYDATITVFDWDTVSDHATYSHPSLPPTGIDFVIVNGEMVLDHGVFSSNRPGKFFYSRSPER